MAREGLMVALHAAIQEAGRIGEDAHAPSIMAVNRMSNVGGNA